MKSGIVYKIVNVMANGNMRSAFFTPYPIEYKLRKVSFPMIGKIFVFESFKLAKKFANKKFMQDFMILKGFANEIEKPKYMACYGNKDFIVKFWKKRMNKESLKNICVTVPEGTLYCSEFRPTEVVFSDEE